MVVRSVQAKLAVALAVSLLAALPLAAAKDPIALAIVTPRMGATVSGLTPLVGTSAMSQDKNGDGFVVIAVIDTGINPYNPDFNATKAQPAGGTVNPSTYLPGYPTGVPALPLTCTATTSISTACISDFSGVPWAGFGGATPASALRWIPGTKIIGAISFDNTEGPILDTNAATGGHGTLSASVAVGNIDGTCPECLLVVVQGLGGGALDWASAQPWIDITSNSYGMDFRCLVPSVPPDPLAIAGCPPQVAGTIACYAACAAATGPRPFVEKGGTAVFAAGNGNLNMFDSPQETHLSPLAGPDWIFVAGAIERGPENSILGSGKPVTASSYAAGIIPAACFDNNTQYCNHGGTSAATPQIAGVAGKVLLTARNLLHDWRTGPRGTMGGTEGIAAHGAPVYANQYLKDGNLTRHELWALVTTTALPLGGSLSIGTNGPASPVDYAYAGYGIVNATSRDRAITLLGCGVDLPDRSDVDSFMDMDSVVRQFRWDSWNESKFDYTLGHVGARQDKCLYPVPQKIYPVTFAVNGVPLTGGVVPTTAGAWTFPIDFSLQTAVRNNYVVEATYGGITYTTVYHPPNATVNPQGGNNDPQKGGETPFPQDGTSAGGDVDNDGVSDHFDNCPRLSNADQKDLDGDGLGDACDLDIDGDGYTNGQDLCPTVWDNQLDTDSDGIGDACDTDIDGDGIANSADLCPLARDPTQKDLDHDTVGDACDPDRDGDGIPNQQDAFPDDPLNWTDKNYDGLGDQTAAAPGTVQDRGGDVRAPSPGVQVTAKAPPLALGLAILGLAGAAFVARRRA